MFTEKKKSREEKSQDKKTQRPMRAKEKQKIIRRKNKIESLNNTLVLL